MLVVVINIVDKLKDLNLMIGTMESCTGGLIASTITDSEGASSVFKGSLVTYSNDEKVKAGVDSEIISTYGVYSYECARAMALTMVNKYNNTVGVGITGTLGNLDTNNPLSSTQGKVYYAIVVSYLDSQKTIEGCITVDVEKYTSRKEQKKYVCNIVMGHLNDVLDIRRHAKSKRQ